MVIKTSTGATLDIKDDKMGEEILKNKPDWKKSSSKIGKTGKPENGMPEPFEKPSI